MNHCKRTNGIFIKNIIATAAVVLFTFAVILPRMNNSGELTADIFLSDSNGGEIVNANLISDGVTENTAEDAYAAVLKEPETVQANVTADDIKQMQKEYTEKYKNSEPAGTVDEVFFTTDAATDTVGRVAIRNCTSQELDFGALLKEGAPVEEADFSEPTVLIFHTHTTESYLQVDDGVFYKDYETRSEDSNRNMVRVGNEICTVLENEGIGVIHDTTVYDRSYNGAYSRSRVTVLDYLEKYPTIQIVLDVHRDAIYYSATERCKPCAVINGKKAAQVMIITGAEDGQVSDFPNWRENLKFALALQNTAQEMYEGLMKPIYFCQRKYNMDTALCSLLLEFGSDANTLEEACYSGKLMGEVLAKLIKG